METHEHDYWPDFIAAQNRDRNKIHDLFEGIKALKNRARWGWDGGHRGEALVAFVSEFNEDQLLDPIEEWRLRELVGEIEREESLGHPSDGAFVPAAKLLEGRPEGDGLEWVLEGFLPRGYLAVLGGTSKAGKSCFVTAMALAILRGEPFMGFPPGECPAVLWCAYEESDDERAMALRRFGELPPGLWHMRNRAPIDDKAGLATMRKWIRATKARLVVVDPLYAAHSQEGLTDGQSARRALQGLKDLAGEEGCAVVIIHHINKNVGIGMARERMADSAQILAAASMDLLLDAAIEEDGTRRMTLRGRGRGEFCNRVWKVLSDGPTSFVIEEGEDEGKPAVTRAMRAIVDHLAAQGEATAKDIAESCGLMAGSVRNSIRTLVERGTIQINGQTGRGSSASRTYALA